MINRSEIDSSNKNKLDKFHAHSNPLCCKNKRQQQVAGVPYAASIFWTISSTLLDNLAAAKR